MIEMRVLSAPFVCRTKDLLWYRETKQCIELLKEGKTLDEIKELSQNENIFNAASSSRADNIPCCYGETSEGGKRRVS